MKEIILPFSEIKIRKKSEKRNKTDHHKAIRTRVQKQKEKKIAQIKIDGSYCINIKYLNWKNFV